MLPAASCQERVDVMVVADPHQRVAPVGQADAARCFRQVDRCRLKSSIRRARAIMGGGEWVEWAGLANHEWGRLPGWGRNRPIPSGPAPQTLAPAHFAAAGLLQNRAGTFHRQQNRSGAYPSMMDLDRTLRVAPARRPPSPCPLIGTAGRDQQGRGRGGDCLWRAPMAVASACASGPKPKSSTEAIPARGQRLLEHLRPSGPPVPAFAIRDRCQE